MCAAFSVHIHLPVKRAEVPFILTHCSRVDFSTHILKESICYLRGIKCNFLG